MLDSKCKSVTNRLPVQQYSFESSAFKQKVMHIREREKKKVTSLGTYKEISHVIPTLASKSLINNLEPFLVKGVFSSVIL